MNKERRGPGPRVENENKVSQEDGKEQNSDHEGRRNNEAKVHRDREKVDREIK